MYIHLASIDFLKAHGEGVGEAIFVFGSLVAYYWPPDGWEGTKGDWIWLAGIFGAFLALIALLAFAFE